MQTFKVRPGQLKSEIFIPSSKSYANRSLIIAAVKDTPITLHHLPRSTDVTLLVEALKKIGLNLSSSHGALTILNSFPQCEGEGCEIEVGEGGTTARFLAALLLLGKKEYKLLLGKRLKERPWTEFIELVRKHGGKAELNDRALTIRGPLSISGELIVDCSKTTQFATAFKMILPPGTVKPIHLTSSQSYWRMTEKILQEMSLSTVYSVPLDWSSASYPLAFAALNHEIEFPHLEFDESQADAKFLSILQKYHSVKVTKNGLRVFPGDQTGNLVFDVSDALDLVPALAFYLSHIQGAHKLSGIKNLIHKESDRLNEMIRLMKHFNRSAFVENDTLIIHGHHEKMIDEKDLVLPDDHRMVMAAALFLLHHSGGSVTPSNAVEKSYPDFFKILLNP